MIPQKQKVSPVVQNMRSSIENEIQITNCWFIFRCKSTESFSFRLGELGFQEFWKDAVFEVESVLIASGKGVSVYLVVFLLNHLIAKKTKCAFVDF